MSSQDYYAVEFVSNTTTTTTTTVCNNGSYQDMAYVLHNNWRKVFEGMRQMNGIIEKCTQGQANPLVECTKARDCAVNLLNDLNSVLFQYQQAHSLQQHLRNANAPQFPPRGSPVASPASPNRRRTSSSTPAPQQTVINSAQSKSEPDQKRAKTSNVKQEVSRSSSFPPSRSASPLNVNQHNGMPFIPVKVEGETFIKREADYSPRQMNSNSNTPSNSPPSSPPQSPSIRAKRTISDLLN